MPSRTTDRSNPKWRARCRLNGMEIFLGTFDTKEEAEAKQAAFRRRYPSRQGDQTIGMRTQGILR